MTKVPHGTPSRYQYGCRCKRCRGAKAAASRRKRAASGADSLIRTKRVVRHLTKLGESPALIARIAGLNWNTVDRIAKRKFVHRSTAEKILSVTRSRIAEYYANATQGYVSPATVEVLLRDLEASGHSLHTLGRRNGTVSCFLIQGKRTQAKHARRIESIYRLTGVLV